VKKSGGFFAQATPAFCKNMIATSVSDLKKRQFFGRKWAKLAGNCDHNIDPEFITLKSLNFQID
jgi:hypothetical protein